MTHTYKKRLPEGPFYRDLGHAIRAARGKAGKSQEEVAEHLDLTFQQVQKYENGTNRIPIDRLVSLAQYLEVPAIAFIDPSASDSKFQALASQFSAREFHALLEAWGSLKDRSARSAVLNIIRCMAKLER